MALLGSVQGSKEYKDGVLIPCPAQWSCNDSHHTVYTMARRHGRNEVRAHRLTEPLKFSFANRTATNRFLKAAMTERISSWDPVDTESRGIPSNQLINLYRRWGEGEIGTILTGNIMVDTINLEAPGNAIIPADAAYSGERFERFQALASAAKAQGSLIVGQISHPGRQVNILLSPSPISASDVQIEKEIWGMRFGRPHAASHREIRELVAAFTHAAQFLYNAGFDGIQLHGAHGYLLAQFLSRATNKRTDQYGGSMHNRSRIVLEIARSIRQSVPASTGFILGIKLNSVEFQEEGFSPDECRELCQILETDAQFDFVELSGGTYEDVAFEHKRDSTRRREAFFLEFADAVAPVLSQTKVFVTGGFRTVQAMEAALETVDGVGMARSFCAEPFFASDTLAGRVKTGTIDIGLSQYDYGMTETVAGVQMRQISQDQAPIDLTQKANLDAFEESVMKWEQDLAADRNTLKMAGFPEVKGVELQPLETPLAKISRF